MSRSWPRSTRPPVSRSGAGRYRAVSSGWPHRRSWRPQVEPLAGTDAAAPDSGAILAMDEATGQLRSQTVLPAPPVAPPLVAGAAGNHRVLMLESADGLDYVVT